MNNEDLKALATLTRRGSSMDGMIRFDGFDINKAFNEFTEYLEGYQEFMIKDIDPEMTRERILESLDRFIDKTIDTSSRIKYSKLMEFTNTYPVRSKELMEKVDSIKVNMLLESVQPESVGDVGDLAEKFLEKVGARYNEVIESVMRENGFRNMAIPMKPKEEEVKEPEVSFL